MRKVFQHSGYTAQCNFWLSIVLVGSWYLYLNLCIPFYADDYSYSMVFGTSRHLESLIDVIVSARAYYQGWGGRLVSMVIEQLALLGKWQTVAFCVLNTCVFLGLNLLIVDFGKSKPNIAITSDSSSFKAVVNSSSFNNENRRSTWMLFFISFYLFWIFVRTLGEITLRLTGSVFYLWTLFFILCS